MRALAQNPENICRGTPNSPDHLLNTVDSNCVPYTSFQLSLFVGGCLMWVIAYGLLLRNIRHRKFVEMAALAVCSNFAWEFTWSTFNATDMGLIPSTIYRAWLFLDVFILWQLLRYGAKQVINPTLKKAFVPLCLMTTVGFTCMYGFFVDEGYDTPIGANSAYICQLILSSSCLLLLLGPRPLADFSLPYAWLRSIATGMNTAFMLLHYPDNHFLHSLGLLALVLDASFLTLYLRRAWSENGVCQLNS